MERGSSGQIHLYPDDIQKLLVPIPNKKQVITKAVKTIEPAYMDINNCKKTIRNARLQISQILSPKEIADEYAKYDTIIPISEWRIKRPSKS